jgi:hypothetical protein
VSDNIQVAGGGDELLDELVATDLHRIREVLVEAGRSTVTPGVYRELSANLVARLGGQLQTEAALLEPAVSDVLGSDAADRLAASRTQLARHLDELAADPDRPVPTPVVDAFNAHRDALTVALVELRHADPARVRALAFAYADRADTVSEP